jgi:anti-sigma B factor antagonist
MQVVPSPSADPPAFWFAVARSDSSRVSLAATGELDLAAVEDLAALMALHEAAGRTFFRFDLSGVTFMDCSCLGVLVGVHHRLNLRQGQLILTDVSAPVARLLAVTGLAARLLVTSEPENPLVGASA